ncbi:MAG: NAD-dependent epimerase/dehydratase family protein [Acidobacteria bacterium]|nr:MAG: NAD-dependent epimerase/dehydratase family protein [Acidobacteriota bacterium]REK01444.1 MAG: NAD-dependent epimerase/dehydratase family protein [Acidobacteriota bacterium]REK14400.1 MAG: NAD-dependent epimerase/dehydratase family protein [Acidobacteriota bacterium]REK45115.1 MAG: NAD-dependent epimerase/dehydratase family protein [Acidobacteriota bacterium]
MAKTKYLDNKSILVTGGTGSLGQALVRRILTGEYGKPSKVTVYSRDEAKQHFMRLDYLQNAAATDEVIYHNSRDVLDFTIGDVRDYPALLAALRGADIVFHAAALKQVPSCEYFPFEAVLTNIHGAQNIVRAIRENPLDVEKVVGISTDKACKPINVMGMTKAIQERVLIEANRQSRNTAFNCVRYGNVIASRGSIVPLFVDQIRNGRPVTVTLAEMTRFLLTLEKAVDTVMEALMEGKPGETYVPRVESAKITDVAKALMGAEQREIVYTGIRPGEKIHEIMVSEEECFRTVARNGYYVILPVLPELRGEGEAEMALDAEYSSQDDNISVEKLREVLSEAGEEIRRFIDDSNQ